MQRLSTTNAVRPKGRIINSCTVDHQTGFKLLMETQENKLTSGFVKTDPIQVHFVSIHGI
jgi:hypothetical protein